MKTRVHVLISGLVQGVWFRASTRDKAEQLGIKGWVKNTYDGNVEAVFEGEKIIMKEMLAWCHDGPKLANVTGVKVDYEQPTEDFEGFNIIY
jgi:acylphosphatase